jgi:hypothetical protein
MKAIKTLTEVAFNGVATASTGNHGFIRDKGRNVIVFYYHLSPVCVLNLDTKTFRLDDCGYKTSSTTRTLNAYRDELTARGFTCSQVK